MFVLSVRYGLEEEEEEEEKEEEGEGGFKVPLLTFLVLYLTYHRCLNINLVSMG